MTMCQADEVTSGDPVSREDRALHPYNSAEAEEICLWLLGQSELTDSGSELYRAASIIASLIDNNAILRDELRNALAENSRLREALKQLEDASDGLCATRSRETYLRMVDHDGAADALEELDTARRNARDVLASAPRPDEERSDTTDHLVNTGA